MSEEEVTPVYTEEDLEIVARYYCKAMGMDAEQPTAVIESGVLQSVPLWRAIRKQAISAIAWQYAVTTRVAELAFIQELRSALRGNG